MASLLICMFLGPRFIELLREREFGQHIREDGPAGHHGRAGTPPGGAILISASGPGPALALAAPRAASPAVRAPAVASAALGFADDWVKLQKRRSLGLSG